MKKIGVYYLDDDLNNINYFKTLVDNQEALVLLGCSTDYLKAIEDVKLLKPHIVVIDIELPEISGFQFAEIIKPICENIIFLTCHTKFAMDAYKFDPIHYLIKPIGYIDLKAIVERYEKRQKNMNTITKDQLVINTLKSFEFVNYSDIIYIESHEGYSHFNIQNENQNTVSSKNLKHYEMELTAHPDFFRIHKSYIINKKKLKQIVKISNTNFLFKFIDGRNFNVASFNKDKWLDNFLN